MIQAGVLCIEEKGSIISGGWGQAQSHGTKDAIHRVGIDAQKNQEKLDINTVGHGRTKI